MNHVNTCPEPGCPLEVHPDSEGGLCAVHEAYWWEREAINPVRGETATDAKNRIVAALVESYRWSRIAMEEGELACKQPF